MIRPSWSMPSSATAFEAVERDSSVRPLVDLQPGDNGVVHQILAPEPDASRLKAMGLCQGRRLQLVKAGDPLIVRVLGTRIGLSARLARFVLVQPCPSD